jgi:shikimate dehydrogenase
MRRFGLIGYPLTHSFSKDYFTNKFEKEHISDAVYENFPLESIGDIDNLIKKHRDIKGLNVTIPYKEKIIPYLNKLDKSAKEVGAVNTIKFEKDQNNKTILVGYNTDIYGFETTIRPYLECPHKKALILGTGGASKAVKFVLGKLGLHCLYVSRNPADYVFKTYKELTADDIADSLIIVNTTPLGMYPKIEEYPPIPYKGISSQHIVFDLIYNPSETAFLSKAKTQGAKTLNGLEMLHLQAEKSWEIWNL